MKYQIQMLILLIFALLIVAAFIPSDPRITKLQHDVDNLNQIVLTMRDDLEQIRIWKGLDGRAGLWVPMTELQTALRAQLDLLEQVEKDKSP